MGPKHYARESSPTSLPPVDRNIRLEYNIVALRNLSPVSYAPCMGYDTTYPWIHSVYELKKLQRPLALVVAT